MSKSKFDELFKNLRSKLTFSINHRYPASAGELLVVTLLHLPAGDSQQTILIGFCLEKLTVNKNIRKTCGVIWNELKAGYIQFSTVEMWENIAQNLGTFWQCSDCVGAIDDSLMLATDL